MNAQVRNIDYKILYYIIFILYTYLTNFVL